VIDFERLQIFLRIVELGSMRAAARAVHLTQPAVSRSIKLLEDEMSAELFARQGRGLVLTAAGRALVPRAKALLALAERAEREVARSAERDYFDLRLGTIDSVATFLLPAVLTALACSYPDLVMRLNTARTATLLDRVRDDMLDVAVIAHSGPPESVRATRAGPYELRYWARADRFAALGEVTTMAQLRDFPVVEIEPPPGDPGAEPKEVMSHARLSNVATVKAMVMAGFGVGDLTDFMLSEAERAQLVAARIHHDPDCALYVVTAPGWSGEVQHSIARQLVDGLARALDD
jgi:DNA-binding transcriptional LysR family regulator